MKKVLLTAIIASLVGGAAFAQTNVVTSANVVGYNQITIPSNQYVLVSLSFNNASNTIDSLFGTLPTGAQVILWDTAQQAYTTFGKTRSGWGAGGTNTLDSGIGAFVSLPVNVQTNIYMSGDVPTNATLPVYVVSGYRLIAYPFPADVAFTNTSLAINGATGDSISLWNNGWTTYGKTRSGWGEATNLQLQVGQALFYKASSNSTVNLVKPYTLD